MSGTGILAFGLIITSMAGFRVLLLGVDILTGNRPHIQLQGADKLLIGLTLLGIFLLLFGLYLVKSPLHSL
ncbi:MAG: hypothetical protein M1296_07190 [Chloroflexi bacterium]|nr:hypothetical protein [Chloroflexota bacterium]